MNLSQDLTVHILLHRTYATTTYILRTVNEVIFVVMRELRKAEEEILTIVTPGIILSMKSLILEVGILDIRERREIRRERDYRGKQAWPAASPDFV